MILTVTLNPAVDKFYMIEEFSMGNVNRAKYVLDTAGGKGLNVSRVCRILGEDVTATGFLGGRNGKFIRENIKKVGIKDAFADIEGETRTCLAVYDEKNKTSTEILETGPLISEHEKDAFLNNYSKIVRDADIITISGSLPMGILPDFYGDLISIAKKNNKTVLLDTSGDILKASLPYKPFMIKPNLDELKYISGMNSYRNEMVILEAEKLYKKGIPLVCVTLGKDGCIAVFDKGVYNLLPPKVEPINTVGSGDSFVAGFASYLLRKYSITDCLINAIACGIANTQFSETGKVSLELVESYKKQIKVIQIK